MIPWDNSTDGVVPFNKSRNAFGEMKRQLVQNVKSIIFYAHSTKMKTQFLLVF